MVDVHRETKQSLIDECTNVAGTLIKEIVVHRAEMNAMEQKHDHRLELEQARQEHSNRSGGPHGAEAGAEAKAELGAGHGTPQHRDREPVPVESQVVDQQAGVGQPDFDRVIDRLEQRDQCSLCRNLLDAIRDEPPDVQAEALAEYGRLKGAMESGATQADLENIIEDSETLQRLVRSGLDKRG